MTNARERLKEKKPIAIDTADDIDRLIAEAAKKEAKATGKVDTKLRAAIKAAYKTFWHEMYGKPSSREGAAK